MSMTPIEQIKAALTDHRTGKYAPPTKPGALFVAWDDLEALVEIAESAASVREFKGALSDAIERRDWQTCDILGPDMDAANERFDAALSKLYPTQEEK